MSGDGFNSFPVWNDDQLRRIARDLAANYTSTEIAQRHSLSLRTAERKIQLTQRMRAEDGDETASD